MYNDWATDHYWEEHSTDKGSNFESRDLKKYWNLDPNLSQSNFVETTTAAGLKAH